MNTATGTYQVGQRVTHHTRLVTGTVVDMRGIYGRLVLVDWDGVGRTWEQPESLAS